MLHDPCQSGAASPAPSGTFTVTVSGVVTLIPNVLVAGGLGGLNSNSGSTFTAMLYDPATGAWTSTGSLHTAREDQTATLLNNGQVLAAGGVNFVKHTFTQLASTDLYTP